MPIWVFGLVALGFTTGCETVPTRERPEAAHTVAAGVTPPVPVSCPAPPYPRELRREGRSGLVTVSFSIFTDGTVGDIVVLRATHPLMAEAVKSTLASWRFRPATRAGQPLNSGNVVQTIEFRVEGSAPEKGRPSE